MKYRYTDEQFIDAIKNSLSIAETCRKLGIIPKGSNYKIVNNKIKSLNVDISHFTGKAWNQGVRFREFKPKKDLSLILIENSSYTVSNSLKKRLINEGLLINKCKICGLTNWLGKELVCELDHINGINTDNRIENLRILCPNCHSQTHTFRGKNKNKESPS